MTRLGKSTEDADVLRMKLWHSRNSLARPLGLAMLALSSAFFLGAAYLPNQTILEVTSATAFIFGVILLASDIEQRVKLLSASASLYGPTIAFSRLAEGRVEKFKAVFRSTSNGVQGEGVVGMMSLIAEEPTGGAELEMPSVGDGLVTAYERELGSLQGKDGEYLTTWLPRVMTQALGLAEKVKIKESDSTLTSTMVRPFVRALCVRESMQNSVCCTTGCALAASIGQSFARGLDQDVAHVSCTYDPISQTATSIHRLIERRGSP
jgi:hypothetical protein